MIPLLTRHDSSWSHKLLQRAILDPLSRLHFASKGFSICRILKSCHITLFKNHLEKRSIHSLYCIPWSLLNDSKTKILTILFLFSDFLDAHSFLPPIWSISSSDLWSKQLVACLDCLTLCEKKCERSKQQAFQHVFDPKLVPTFQFDHAHFCDVII